jgi:transcriptional regulator with XRE-family HTH domain
MATMASRASGPVSDALRKAILEGTRSQSDLARALGIYPSVLSRFLSGERDLRLGVVDALARELGLELKARKAPRKAR